MSPVEPVATTAEPAFAVDRDGTILSWNRAAVETLGLPAAKARGRKCWKVLAGRDIWGNTFCSPGCPLLRMARDHEPLSRCWLLFRSASGRMRPFSVSTLVLPGTTPEERALVHVLSPAPRPRGGPRLSPRSPSRGGHRADLRPSDLELLGQLGSRRTSREIAHTLLLTEAELRTRIRHLLRTLGARDRLEAVVVGRRLGLIPDPMNPEPPHRASPTPPGPDEPSTRRMRQ